MVLLGRLVPGASREPPLYALTEVRGTPGGHLYLKLDIIFVEKKSRN